MASRLKPAAARTHIASGALEPLYLVVGGDQAEKTGLVAAFGDVIEAELRAFNVERVYGGEIAVHDLLDLVRILPMMVPRRLVIVMQAEKILEPKKQNEDTERDLDALGAYIQAPESLTTVVFVADALDRRRRLAKLLEKHAVVIECGMLADGGEAVHWIRARVAEHGMAIEPEAAALLVRRAGLDVARLRGEVERACLFAAGRQTVTLADAMEVAGAAVSLDEWAVVNAMRTGATALALRELALLFDAGEDPRKLGPMVLGQIRSYVEKLPTARQGPAFDVLLRTDLALKTSAGDPRILLERLVVELCEGGQDGRRVCPPSFSD
jgi:DNA polymerase-3 subunit delta